MIAARPIASLLLAALVAGAPLVALAQAETPPPPASAPTDDDIERARGFFENGAVLYEEGQYEAAILAWQEAYRLTGYPDLIYNIADAWERLGKFDLALAELNRYRAYAGVDERERLDRRLRTLEERVRSIEDERRAEEERRRADEAERKRLEDEKRAAELAARRGEPEPVDDGPSFSPSVLSWTLLGTTLVGAGAGTWFALETDDNRTQLRKVCRDGDSGLVCPPSAASLDDDQRNNALFADIGFGVAALSAIGLAVSLVLDVQAMDEQAPDNDGDTVLAPVFRPDGGGVLLRARF